jgi:lactate permease
MPWIQTIDPLKNIPLSALVAAIPVIFIFWALIKKMKGYVTSLLALAIAIFIALLIYGMPLKLAMLSTLSRRKFLRHRGARQRRGGE